jgi:magnesium-transporting ATPase (P-type)
MRSAPGVLAGRPADVPPLHQGLSAEVAADRLARLGPNVLPKAPGPRVWRRLLDQMTHFFALLLWVASGLAIVAGMPQLGVAIVIVVLINGLFAFAQEYRADRAAERLGDLMPARAVVRRDGHLADIDARDLVVGDVVLLSAGDRVSADLTVAEAHSTLVDTSMLTGESVPDAVDVGQDVHAGTFVVEGEGVARVVATGAATRLAGIARLTHQGHHPPSPLALELNRVVRAIAFIALGIGGAFFAVSLLTGTSLQGGFLFAIGVTVALVPEGLLPTVTLSLAMGAQRMAHRNALVRRLESVETLGSTTFICTDKTGTLTCNQMAVVEVWTPQGPAYVHGGGYGPDADVNSGGVPLGTLATVAATALTCSTGRAAERDGAWVAVGDPMDAAVDALTRRLPGAGPAADAARRAAVRRRFPFDPHRRRTSVLTETQLAVKGAPDSVLQRCADVPAATARQLRSMTDRGLRVLAVATRPAAEVGPGDDADRAERGLRLLGLLGFLDPPRRHVTAAIEDCRRAGIRVAMVTGDHPATARAIARQVGLLGRDAIVLEGRDLPADDDLLGVLLDRDGIVVARVEPEDKLRIARALQARGHVVAMTGDGVNDGPALQEADVGIAMGASGTDVAREASDLVLLDDDFATIVAAVEQGRATFANIRRFLTYHLTDNVAELTPFVVWALSAGQFPLAIGVLQVLALDIGTDLLPALALGAEQPNRDVMRRPPEGRHLLDRAVFQRVFGVLGPAEALVEMSAFVAVLALAGWHPGADLPGTAVLAAASGAAFAAVVFGQLGNAFACRSQSRPAWRLNWRSNPLLLLAVVVELAALAGFLLVPPVADLLGHDVPTLAGALIALLAVPAVLGADAVHKALRRRPAGRDVPTTRGGVLP